MLFRQHRNAVGTDFVRHIAIGRDTIRPDHYRLQLPLAH